MFESLIASIKAGGKRLDNFQDLLVSELKDLYDVETQLIDKLPDMADAASSPQLKQAFREHLSETRRQRERLDTAFQRLNERPEAERCEAIRGILKENESVMKADGDPTVKDAAILSGAQRVEHYEMAVYGSARSHAQQIGRTDIADLLQQTLDEEGDADHRLTDLALAMINPRAAEA